MHYDQEVMHEEKKEEGEKKKGKKEKKKRKGGKNEKKGRGNRAAAFGMNPHLLKEAEDSMQQQRDFLKSLE